MLLLRLGTTSSDPSAIAALRRKVEIDMLASKASLILCRFSGEGFRSDALVYPVSIAGLVLIIAVPLALLVLALVLLGRVLNRGDKGFAAPLRRPRQAEA